MNGYSSAFARSVNDPNGFWGDAARLISWDQEPTTVLDASGDPFYRWFTDGRLNTCYNAVDRHVEQGRGEQAAIIYDSPVTGSKRKITYAQLQDEVARCAGALRALGVEKGDRVVIYMPMVPEAATAMLACARLGAVHSVVFGGFAPNELATRIDDADPKVIISASCGIEVSRVIEYKPMLDRAIEIATNKPERCIILQRPQAPATLGERDVDWNDATGRREACGVRFRAGDRPALHPLHVRHHGQAEGRRARQRRARGRACLEHGCHLRHRPGRRVVGRVRRRLGRRSLLHRLRPAVHRRDLGAVRGQAGGHPRRRRLLASDQ